MCAWALLWFAYFLERADASSLVPMLLIAFSVATGPWAYMAQKEAQGGNNQSSFTAFFLQLACAVIFVLLTFVGVHPRTALLTFLAIMGIAFLLNVAMAIIMAVAESNSSRTSE
jgi:UDP-N-acetylmuramyl pentapeptide phosphotransferase/UDP-N-acetylglucosamine-1-phosphate transferase